MLFRSGVRIPLSPPSLSKPLVRGVFYLDQKSLRTCSHKVLGPNKKNPQDLLRDGRPAPNGITSVANVLKHHGFPSGAEAPSYICYIKTFNKQINKPFIIILVNCIVLSFNPSPSRIYITLHSKMFERLINNKNRPNHCF